MARRMRISRGWSPPATIVMVGSDTVWREASWRHRERPPAGFHSPDGSPPEFYNRESCPAGCASRDLDWERAVGMDRLCLRCLCHSADPPKLVNPMAVMLAELKRQAKERKAELRAASFAARKFAGRKAARATVAP